MEEKERDISLENLDRECPFRWGTTWAKHTRESPPSFVTDADGEIWSTKVNART